MRLRVVIALCLLNLATTCGAALADTTPFPMPELPPPLPAAPGLGSAPPAAPAPAVVAPTPSPAAPSVAAPAIAAPAAALPVVAAHPPAPALKRKAPPALALESALSADPTPSFQPDTEFATQKAAERYADIVKTGGWPTDIVALRPRAIGPAVAELRKRLSIEGDLDAGAPIDGPAAEIWDENVTAAVKRFQSRMGLRETGIVAGATLKAIDVPADARATALAASAQRLANFNFGFGDRYVVVNLPSTVVEAVENGVVAHRFVAIVGNPDHPSPEIAAHIFGVNLNPTWTVPVSIIKKEIIPHMLRDPGYLARQKIRILDASGAEIEPQSIDWTTQRAANYTLRQDSGSGNSLGSIRIDMPNKLAVYMHDTPSKRLFGADYRFLSHGCVRVQGVYDYAEWLLQGTTDGAGRVWDKTALLAGVKTGERAYIRLARSVPVIWIYMTGWANDDGPAHFRDDVYGLDTPAVASAAGDLAAAPAAPAQ